MTDSPTSGSDWVGSWIEQQREQLRRLSTPAGGADSDFTRELADRWLAASVAYVRGLARFAQSAPADARSAASGLSDEVFNAWQGGFTGASAAGSEAARHFADTFARLPALGIAREHVEAWRELAAAQSQCQELEHALRLELLRVQNEALQLLEQRLRERDAAGKPITAWRELYDLWVECGEQAYAQVAHGEAYARLQAELGNAAVRLRTRQQAILEHAAKQLDLPTRSELNSVHRQLRELRARLGALEAAADDRGGDER